MASKAAGHAQQTMLLSVGGSFLSFILVLYFVFFSSLRGLQALSRQIKEKKANLETVKASTGEYQSIEEKTKKIKEQIETVKGRVFGEGDSSRFLDEITQLASDLKIEFVSLKPELATSILLTPPEEKEKKPARGQEKAKEPQPVPDYSLTEVPISIIIKSNYEDLVKFLERIEQADKFIAVQSLNIEADRQDIITHSIKMDLSIFTK